MKTSTRSAMERLAAARPPVADHTEGIVLRAERARFLQSIVETSEAASVAPSATPSIEPMPGPATPVRSPEWAWTDPAPSGPGPRRRVLTAALVAAVVASGLGVAGLVGTGNDAAQVSAGPGEGSPAPSEGIPAAPGARFLPGSLPEGMVLQDVVVKPGAPPLPGSPYAEVYGRMGPEGTIEQAVAVLTARTPDFLDVILADSGATTEPVPGDAGQLDIDFGEGLVARSFTARPGEPERVCGTNGCVDVVDQELPLVTLVLGRDLEGGASALTGVIDDLEVSPKAEVPGDRINAPTLVAEGFRPVYEGDQVPGLTPGTGTTALHYGDERGQRSVTFRLAEGQDFDPAGVAWQYPETRAVEVRGHDGLLVANDLGSSVTWQERPGLTISVDVFGLTENEAVDVADGVGEVTEEEWHTVAGVSGAGEVADIPDRVSPSPGASGDSVSSSSTAATGPETVLGEGEAGGLRWQLVGYPVDPQTGSGADVCTDLRVDGATVSVSCLIGPGPLEEGNFTFDSYVNSLGPERELGDQVLVRGQLLPAVASVRFLLDTGETLDVPTVGTDERLGTHVVAAMPADAQGATVVLLDGDGAELQRMAFPSFRPVGG